MEQRHKLVVQKKGAALYDIIDDPAESKDLSAERPSDLGRMKAALAEWKAGVMADKARIP